MTADPAPRHAGRRTVLIVAAIWLVGLLLSSAAWLGVAHYWDKPAVQSELNALGDNRRLLLQIALNDVEKTLQTAWYYFQTADDEISREKFNRLVDGLTRNSSVVVEIGWAPRVRRDRTDEREKAARQDGIAGYRTTPPDREELYPLLYVANPLTTSTSYGLNLFSDPAERAALERARDEGRLAAASLAGGPDALLRTSPMAVLAPVYGVGQPHATVDERRRTIAGFVRGVFLPSEVFEDALHYVTSPRGLDIQFFRANATASEQPLYVRSSLLRITRAEPRTRGELEAGFHWTGEITFADTAWTMVVVPISRAPVLSEYYHAGFVAFAGLLLTFALSMYVALSERYAARLKATLSRLRESEETFHNLGEHAQDAVVMTNPLGNVTYWNTAAERIFGYSPPEAHGRNVHEMLVPERDRAESRAGYSAFAVTGQGAIVGTTQEITAVRKDGTEFPIEISVSGVRRSDGWNAIAIARDITDRKSVEQAIRESEEKYRDLVESTTDYIWQIDATGHYTYASPAIQALTGLEPAEIIGKTPFEVMSPAEAQRAASSLAQIAARQQPFSQLEETILTKDGAELVVETSGVPVFDDHGNFSGYRGISRNVTQRVLATNEMKHQSALLHAVAAAAAELLGNSLIDDAVPKALERIGKAVNADRVVVLEVQASSGDWPLLALRYTWRALDAPAVPSQTLFNHVAQRGIEHEPWFAPLTEGRHMTAVLSTSSAHIRAVLTDLGIRSILAVPLMVDGKFCGLVDFADCTNERQWTTPEIDILKTLADLISTAMTRARYVKELSDANMIVEHSPSILYRMGGEPSLPMIYLSHNIALLGHDPDEMLHDPQLFKTFIHSEDADRVREAMARATAPGSDSGVIEFRFRKRDGGYRWLHNRYNPVRDESGRLKAIEGVLTDVTERKEAEGKITRLATTDALTGLANRTTFVRRLRQAFAQAKRGGPGFAVLYLDIDRFKDINDTLGHPVGDRLLRVIAERLRACTREIDLVARLGGDEFAILQSLLPDMSGASALATKIRTTIAAPLTFDGHEVHVTVSVGISPFSSETRRSEDMLSQADLALYRAKEEGRDQYRFHSDDLDKEVRDRMALADDLRKALARNELELHYQPQVELATGRIVGMEALIRWRHPSRGLLHPKEFIPIAERTGVIVALGDWVLDRACGQMRQWHQEGIAPGTIAVNLSLVQIKSGSDLLESVGDTLARWGIAPSELELDVTESMLARARFAQNDVLERLQQLGIRIAIDDFGTQFSSLDYLRAYRVSRLKIPRALVDAATSHSKDAAMVRAIIGIAQELDIEVIAQGVENEAQRAFLTSVAVKTRAQGYYYSQPVTAEQATALLHDSLIGPHQRHKAYDTMPSA
jgi:diguanylate cyclase (GGDEF)-like protein/PAS domain S-box-containing protein